MRLGFDDDPISMMGVEQGRRRPRIRPTGLSGSGVGPRKLIRDWSKLTPAQQMIAKNYGYMRGLGAKGRNDGTHVDVGPITRKNRGAKAIEAAALRQEVLHVQAEVKKGNPVPDTPLLKAKAEATGTPILIPQAKNAPETPAVVVTPKVASNTPIVVNLPPPVAPAASGGFLREYVENNPPPIIQAMAQPSPVFDAPQAPAAPIADAGWYGSADPYADPYAGYDPYAGQYADAGWYGQADPYAGYDPYAGQYPTDPWADVYGPQMQGMGRLGLGLNLGKVFKKVTKFVGKNALPIAAGVASSVLTGGASLPGALIGAGRTLVQNEIQSALAPRPAPAVMPPRPVAPARPLPPRPLPPRPLAPARLGPPAPPAPAAPQSAAPSQSPPWLLPVAIGAAVLLLAKK